MGTEAEALDKTNTLWYLGLDPPLFKQRKVFLLLQLPSLWTFVRVSRATEIQHGVFVDICYHQSDSSLFNSFDSLTCSLPELSGRLSPMWLSGQSM